MSVSLPLFLIFAALHALVSAQDTACLTKCRDACLQKSLCRKVLTCIESCENDDVGCNCVTTTEEFGVYFDYSSCAADCFGGGFFSSTEGTGRKTTTTKTTTKTTTTTTTTTTSLYDTISSKLSLFGITRQELGDLSDVRQVLANVFAVTEEQISVRSVFIDELNGLNLPIVDYTVYILRNEARRQSIKMTIEVDFNDGTSSQYKRFTNGLQTLDPEKYSSVSIFISYSAEFSSGFLPTPSPTSESSNGGSVTHKLSRDSIIVYSILGSAAALLLVFAVFLLVKVNSGNSTSRSTHHKFDNPVYMQSQNPAAQAPGFVQAVTAPAIEPYGQNSEFTDSPAPISIYDGQALPGTAETLA